MKKKVNKLIYRFWILFVCLTFAQLALLGQSLQHPHIWVTDSDKQEILDNIAQYDWAASMFKQLKQRNDSKKSTHLENPATFLASISTVPGNRELHREHLNIAAECGVLYYLSGDETYAQFAANILHHYVKLIQYMDPLNIEFYTPYDDSNHLIAAREIFPRIGIIYDFIQPFLIKSNTKVFDLAVNNYVGFDFTAAQKTFEVLTTNILKVGGTNSNHTVFELFGALYNTLCMENDSIRNYYFDKVLNGDSRQRSIDWMLKRFTNEGMWPESVAYSKETHRRILVALNILNRYVPELNLLEDNLHILDGVFIFENFKYPNNATIAYGDAHRDGSETDYLNRNVLAIAHRFGLDSYKQNSMAILKKMYNDKGGYNPKVETERLVFSNLQQLLWGVHIPSSVDPADIPLYTSVYTEYSGVIAQRNYVENNNEQYGLMYYTGGGTYVHAHATGIDMEIYGAGYVVGPDYGRARTGTDLADTYMSSYAAHNTVIVNGTSHRGISENGSWENIVDPIVLEACEPLAYDDPISENFCFSTQFFDDNINNNDQQRTNGIIRTSATSGYYFDVFRSKSKISNQFHDYLFHGLGDDVKLFDNEGLLALNNTFDRYKSNIGNNRKEPGWHWFSDTNTSALTTKAISARFDLNATDKYLHVNVPGGIEKEYSSALAPPTIAVSKGYDKVDTKMFIMRKYGEAWNDPFVAIYEPSGSETGTVELVENIEKDGKIVGAIVTSSIDGKVIKDYIISLDGDDSVELPEHFISFNGRFGIVRKEPQSETSETITLYIGSGERLSYADLEVLGDADNKNVKTFYGVQKLTADTKFTITTQVFGGGGTISVQPNQADYAPGSQVVVMANPEFGNVVDSWLGNAEGSASTDTITMFSDKNVFVRFRVGDFYTLNTTAEHGSVTQSEEGTDFIEQSCIDLMAVPDEGYQFDGWSGSVSSDENPLTVCFDANKNITANFKVATSIEDVFSESIIVSPNPSTGLLSVQIQQPNTWSLYDLNGILLKTGKADGAFNLDLTSFKKCIFILNIRTNSEVAVKRLILK